jgi:hypothetical protein
MKKNIIFLVLLSFVSVISFAQDETVGTTAVKEKDYPVNGTFESGYLIDAQTVFVPSAKTLEFVIQHKFGTIENGTTDLWGLYKSANVRLGINYVPCKNVQIGAGLTKNYMTTDLSLKWTVLEQTRKNTIPVSVALYGNIGIDGRNKDLFGDSVSVASPVGDVNSFAFSDRLSYFSQLIVARKFNDKLSLQAGVSFSHYNVMFYQKSGKSYDHDKIGVHLNGRYKVSNQGSVIFNYDQPLKIKGISEMAEWNNTYPHPNANVSLGYEVSTGTHAFQIYMGTTNSLLPQESMMFNNRSIDSKGLSLGFVITRLWGF